MLLSFVLLAGSAALGEQTPPQHEKSVWAEYAFPRLNPGMDPKATILADGDDLFLVKASVVKYRLPDTGNVHLLGKAPSRCAALGRDAVYFVAGGKTWSLPRDGGELKSLAEIENLPQLGIKSIACLDRKLYLGFGTSTRGTSGFGCLDPHTGKLRMIASNVSNPSGNLLQGEAFYWITGIVADVKRKCVWLAVEVVNPAWPRARGYHCTGVWRYTPASDTLDQVWPGHTGEKKDSMIWWHGKLMTKTFATGIVLYDPETRRISRVASRTKLKVKGCDEPPALGIINNVSFKYCALDGERLITGEPAWCQNKLMLHRKGHPAEELRRLPDGNKVRGVNLLRSTPHGTLAVIGTEDRNWLRTYFIRRRGPATKATGVEGGAGKDNTAAIGGDARPVRSRAPVYTEWPFDAQEARRRQAETGDALGGLPEEYDEDLGGGVKLRMVLIPAGEFVMGSPERERDRFPYEGPAHRVRITKPFYMGKYEVTNAQMAAVRGARPPNANTDSFPRIRSSGWPARCS